MYGNSTEPNGNIGMTAMHPDNHGTPIQRRPRGRRRSVQEVTDHTVGEQSAAGRQDQHSVRQHRQPPDEKITDPIPLGPGEERRAEAIGESELEHDALYPALLRREHLTRLCRRQVRREPGRVRLRMLDIPPPHSPDMTMSAWTDAPPVMTSPVTQIVPAASCHIGGPVAYLVRRVACRSKSLLGDHVFV